VSAAWETKVRGSYRRRGSKNDIHCGYGKEDEEIDDNPPRFICLLARCHGE